MRLVAAIAESAVCRGAGIDRWSSVSHAVLGCGLGVVGQSRGGDGLSGFHEVTELASSSRKHVCVIVLLLDGWIVD